MVLLWRCFGVARWLLLCCYCVAMVFAVVLLGGSYVVATWLLWWLLGGC